MVQLVHLGEAAGRGWTRAGGMHVEEVVGFGAVLQVELTGLSDGLDEEYAGSRTLVDPRVVGPEHLVMER